MVLFEIIKSDITFVDVIIKVMSGKLFSWLIIVISSFIVVLIVTVGMLKFIFLLKAE